MRLGTRATEPPLGGSKGGLDDSRVGCLFCRGTDSRTDEIRTGLFLGTTAATRASRFQQGIRFARKSSCEAFEDQSAAAPKGRQVDRRRALIVEDHDAACRGLHTLFVRMGWR